MSAPSHAIAKAVVATAGAMLFIAGVFLYFFQKFVLARYHQRHKVAASFRREPGVNHDDIKKVGGNVKALIVEENGVDILYMMDTESRQLITGFSNSILNPSFEDDEEEKRIDKMVQRSKISRPQEIPQVCESPCSTLPSSVSASLTPIQHLPPTPLLAPPCPPLPQASPMILEKKTQQPPPAPPPPPPPPRKEIPKAPPPGPPPLPKANGFVSSLKPPPVPKEKANIKNNNVSMVGESTREKGAGPTRLKPLHWDKVVANVDHSTVWDKINDGSFRFDDELIETLFGYKTNYKTHERNRSLSTLANSNSNIPTQVFILEPRKSQNTAIVLKSLAISRKGILDALLDGQGLSVETLERLTKIAPTKEEEAKIMQFRGNPDKLADAESFLYYILKAVPTAFNRLKAMLFRSSYDCEVLQLKENLQALEMGCKELRTSGLFLKLLEAILKAGNRMNAGTSRGNAQGFNLSALRKLSDVKSTDGKTSLLHFIVEQVVQSEGRRQAMYQNHNLHISNGETSNINEPNSDRVIQQEAEKKYQMLGLQVLGGLSDELSEAKKAASIEYQNFITMCSTLNAHVIEIRQIITCCGNTEKGGFINEMKGFLEECEEELKVVKEEQTRIMELVTKTNEYYLAGASKDNMSNQFQLFVIVKDFVDMVGQACIELKRKLEKKNVGVEAVSTPPLSPSKRTPLRFPNFDLYFLSNLSETSSSQSEDDF
ncbi:formin-like protein 8 [Gastrolobium bilobum]|uniref:formin-like protein 8 n=1 Tax=Gastrolobium bilobum TaxID=150636 RepID=UPI002AB06995|nr:formin-like protein 8 [Gastrolobium bilobum]